jgi:hypothetical protein
VEVEEKVTQTPLEPDNDNTSRITEMDDEKEIECIKRLKSDVKVVMQD